MKIFGQRITGYRRIHCSNGATEGAKSIDSYLTSERETMISERDVGQETGQKWSLIETESVKIKEREKKRHKGNVGNAPLSRISNNPDTNSVSVIVES